MDNNQFELGPLENNAVAVDEEQEEVAPEEEQAAPQVAPEEEEAAPEEEQAAPQVSPQAAPEEEEVAPEEEQVAPEEEPIIQRQVEEIVPPPSSKPQPSVASTVAEEDEEEEEEEAPTRLLDDVGLYPDTTDDKDDFIRRLLEKQEFAESYQEPLFDPTEPIDSSTMIDDEEREFELTPVQRFISNFLSPETPYRSVLLYHGVGVGKTCAAVTTAERFLATFPRQEVLIAAPPRIQGGFRDNIFNINNVKFGNDDIPNHASQCTGDTYLRLTSSFYLDKTQAPKIQRRVNRVIDKRYKMFGYSQLNSYIDFIINSVPANLPEPARTAQQNKRLNQEFSGRLLIIDEAHNLNEASDTVAATGVKPVAAAAEGAAPIDTPGGRAEAADRKEGKQLTPNLKRLLAVVEGMKLMLMTGTPMYNDYKEIIFLLNLLLANDKKKPLIESKVFMNNKFGIFKPAGIIEEDGTPSKSGEDILGEVASKYVSFMRGENPKFFPIRLTSDLPKLREYPVLNVLGNAKLAAGAGDFTQLLPIVPSVLKGDAGIVLRNLQRIIIGGEGGANATNSGAMLRYSNIIYPATEDINYETASKEQLLGRVGDQGFQNIFEARKSGARFYLHDTESSEWLNVDNLSEISPKMQTITRSVLAAEGVCFIFSQFIKAGAIPMGIILEANGFTPYGGARPLLGNGWRNPEGRICVCGRRERRHVDVEHSFNPAKYGLLTGETPKALFEEIVASCQSKANIDGGVIKVIIGSEIASEGIDLRYIRENHLLDSWFHLNKTEQVIGRSIRYKSHMLLPFEKRNTTIFLHVSVYEQSPRVQETIDLYTYKQAFKKAKEVGQVTRVLKSYSVDCNLNRNMLVFKGLPHVNLIDSQRKERKDVSIDDVDFSPLCDFLEKCDFQCMPEVEVKKTGNDDSTYTHFAAQWRMAQLKEVVRSLFKSLDVPFFEKRRLESLPDFASIPKTVLNDILNQIINRKDFVVRNRNQVGYLISNNGYIVFQPKKLRDVGIPLALRTGYYPVKRDYFDIATVIKTSETAMASTSSSSVKLSMNDIMAGIQGYTEWVEALREDADALMPAILKDVYLYKLSDGDSRELNLYFGMADTIKLFIEYMLNTLGEDQMDEVYEAINEYIFDSWFREEDKAKFIQQVDHPLNEDIIKEHIIKYGDEEVYRYVDTNSGNLNYICAGGDVCEPSVVLQIKKLADPFKELSVSKDTTGRLYGFLTWNKVGKMAFKTTAPPKVANNPSKGTECKIITTTSTHRSGIMTLGKVLNEVFGSDFGFNGNDLLKSDSDVLKNPNKICTMFELLLRWMDKEKIEAKRWFYRSVSAFLTNHRGLKSGLGEAATLAVSEKLKVVRGKKKVVKM